MTNTFFKTIEFETKEQIRNIIIKEIDEWYGMKLLNHYTEEQELEHFYDEEEFENDLFTACKKHQESIECILEMIEEDEEACIFDEVKDLFKELNSNTEILNLSEIVKKIKK